MHDSFPEAIRQQLQTLDRSSREGTEAGPSSGSETSRPWCVAVGVHLCGPLAPRAIELFAAIPRLDALVLVPCCLNPRTDGELKAAARAAGEEPYHAKVEQLCGLLRGVGPGVAVSVERDCAMRTNKGGEGSEGGVHSKNALVVALRNSSVRPLSATAAAAVAEGAEPVPTGTAGLEEGKGPPQKEQRVR